MINIKMIAQHQVSTDLSRRLRLGRCRHRSTPVKRGFTLVEMLIAMTITLLMMVAVARAFSFVGSRIRESRGNVKLSNELRNITTRLNDELNRCTVRLEPTLRGSDQSGYFLYSEGPVTDATSSLFRTAVDTDGSVVLPDSRYGDFDDYLAFTAVAPPGSWFAGKVPRYVLDQKAAEVAGVTYTLPVDDPVTTAIDESQFAFEPVTIRSRYAEIVYFASPEYYLVPPGNAQYQQYVDVDGNVDLGSGSATENGLPDRLKIHRRILLIRPDLNLATGNLPIQSRTVGSTSVQFMRADNWPTASTATTVPGAVTADGWAYGMAGVHQQCDLSIHRILNATGVPTVNVAANSLADLTLPHNRFAHVRIPNSVLFGSGGSLPTSMPVLAQSGPATILNVSRASGMPTRMAPPLSGSATAPVVTPSSMSGFLRREFALGEDGTHLDPGPSWGADRRGEEVMINNALGFDLSVFDPSVPLFLTGSGLIVSPNDAGYREALVTAIAAGTPPTSTGGFVDLCYPVLAGGSIRGWLARPVDVLDAAPGSLIPTSTTHLFTPFSGLSGFGNGSQSYANSLYRSGRLVTSAADVIELFQPAFDTYTMAYETDSFLQSRVNTSLEGTLWSSTTGATADLGADGLNGFGIYSPGVISVSGQFDADDLGERETLPPFLAVPSAIRVTFRLENPATRQIRQSSVVVRD